MAKRVLVLGGGRYFGKRLVERLLREGASVTIATRGLTLDGFGQKVERVVLERENGLLLEAVVRGRSWDLVFDQICYSPTAADLACRAFDGRVGRYVHTSTQSVYSNDGWQVEADFDPIDYPIRLGVRADFDYAEGKRLDEAVFFQRAKFPVAALRIPIVLGEDDYTGRLEFHIDRVRSQLPMVVPNLDAEISFISSAEAADVLYWLGAGGGTAVTEPINACANGAVTIKEVLRMLEEIVGKRSRTCSSGLEIDHTPFAGAASRILDNSKARAFGFQFSSIEEWLPGLISSMVRLRA